MRIFHRNHLVLLLLFLIFATPGITAYLFYLHPTWLGEKTTNKGQLITPPILISNQEAVSKWQLLLWSPNVCETNCLIALDKLARVRLALGRRLYNIDFNLILPESSPPVSETMKTRLKKQDIHVVRLSSEEQEHVSIFKQKQGIFIVNPNHYLILAYQNNVKPKDLFHDLKVLLNK